jgi:hypothetical protein
MMLRRCLLPALSLVVGWLTFVPGADAQSHPVDIDRFYHYPHHYFPQSYWPNMEKWPDPRKHMQPPPAYMAYPPYLDPSFRYPLWRPMKYYKGFHFWLDQF